jgi:hypothetical protein
LAVRPIASRIAFALRYGIGCRIKRLRLWLGSWVGYWSWHGVRLIKSPAKTPAICPTAKGIFLAFLLFRIKIASAETLPICPAAKGIFLAFFLFGLFFAATVAMAAYPIT